MTAKTKRFAPGTAASLATAVALAILLGLGTWQGQKAGPKTELLARIDAGMTAPALRLPSHVDNPNMLEYRRVVFRGTPTAQTPARVFGLNREGQPGYFLYAPVKRPLALAVIVNFGWIPISHEAPVPLPSGLLEVQGTLLRSATPGPMTPKNNAPKNIWFTADVQALAAHFGLRTKEYYQFRVFADHSGEPSALPLGGQVLVKIPNNHFQYMLTWYGIGLALVGVFVAYGIKRDKPSP